MAKTKSRKRKKKAKEIPMNIKRLISALICILALLISISLLSGAGSIESDMHTLMNNGGFWSWFFTAKSETLNPIGIFGILSSFGFIYLFGYWLSLALFLLISLAAFRYFIDPELYPLGAWPQHLALTLFFTQSLLSVKIQGFRAGLIPSSLYKLLSMIFQDTGAIIILSLGIVFSMILLFGFSFIKRLWERFIHSFGAKEKIKAQPSISDKGGKDPEVVAEAKPKISDHTEREEPKITIAEPLKEGKPAKEVKPVESPAQPDNRVYRMPSIDDFLESPIKLSDKDRKEIENQILKTSVILQDKLAEFSIEAEVRNVNIGPIITQYELEPAKGVKVSRFSSLADDLALAIKAKTIRVQAPIPGRGLIGIEIPNLTRDMIYLKDLLLSDEMRKHESLLAFGLGKDISGRPIIADLARMPHLLIAGATGSGKSVCINTIIMSLIMRAKPDDLRFILIDPKRVELAGYEDLPHLIGEVVTDPDTALETMYWAVKEMERRYELLQEAKVRDISSYIQKYRTDEELERLPYIVIVVDEFADLIMTSGKDIELPITRLAQMARAVGIHLILATQRPSIKVITGIIKANFPARIAFQVSSRVDSRVILDMMGAERLLGHGDMLFLPPGKAMPERIHGAFVSDAEISRVNDFLAMQPKPAQDFAILSQSDFSGDGSFEWEDELFPEAARVVVRSNTASVSMLQRHFKIGYARAGRLIDQLEQARVVGPHLGSKSREVLANRDDLIELGVYNEED